MSKCRVMESENRMRGEERQGGRREKKEGARRTERAREIKIERCWEGRRERWRERWDVEGWSRAAAG